MNYCYLKIVLIGNYEVLKQYQTQVHKVKSPHIDSMTTLVVRNGPRICVHPVPPRPVARREGQWIDGGIRLIVRRDLHNIYLSIHFHFVLLKSSSLIILDGGCLHQALLVELKLRDLQW